MDKAERKPFVEMYDKEQLALDTQFMNAKAKKASQISAKLKPKPSAKERAVVDITSASKYRNRPKAPSAYFQYMKSARPKYLTEHPEMKNEMSE